MLKPPPYPVDDAGKPLSPPDYQEKPPGYNSMHSSKPKAQPSKPKDSTTKQEVFTINAAYEMDTDDNSNLHHFGAPDNTRQINVLDSISRESKDSKGVQSENSVQITANKVPGDDLLTNISAFEVGQHDNDERGNSSNAGISSIGDMQQDNSKNSDYEMSPSYNSCSTLASSTSSSQYPNVVIRDAESIDEIEEQRSVHL